MKRGGPLPRGDKPLTRSKPLARVSAKPYPKCSEDGCPHSSTRKSGGPCPRHKERKTPVERKAPAAAKPRSEPDRIPAAVRDIVLLRTDRCEACGEPFGAASPHLHHRRRRGPSGGGQHAPDNLVALHPKCHVIAPEAVHQRPDWARSRGLILRENEDPAATPIVLASGRRVLLDPLGPFYLAAT